MSDETTKPKTNKLSFADEPAKGEHKGTEHSAVTEPADLPVTEQQETELKVEQHASSVPPVEPLASHEEVTHPETTVVEVLKTESTDTVEPAENSDNMSSTVEEAENEVDEHSDTLYGNAWEIVKYAGVGATFTWGFIFAAVSGLAAMFLAPQPSWILIAVLSFFIGFIANIDRKTHIIKNAHTLITIAVTVPLGVLVASQLGWWNLLGGVISAVVVMFVFFLLIWFVGFGSGGDLKFAPVAAFSLGVVSPLLPAVWFFLSLIVTMILIVVRSSKSTPLKERNTSFGEGMAISVPVSLVAVYFGYAAAGLPYIT